MKTSTIIIAMLMFVFTNMNAQTYLHQDNFNSAAVDANVTSLGYQLVQTGTIQAADALGNNGSQFVKIAANTSAISFKSPAITNFVIGKSYMLEVMTNVTATRNRTPYVWIVGGTRVNNVAAGTPVSAVGWTKSSYVFIPRVNETEIRVGVFSGTNTADLYIDDLLFYEDPNASVTDVNSSNIKVVKNLLGGEYRIIGDEQVAGYEVFNTNGQLIKTEKGLNSQAVNVSTGDFSKGVYVFKIMIANGKTIIQKIVNN